MLSKILLLLAPAIVVGSEGLNPRAPAYTWPNPIVDELERMLYEQNGPGLNTPAFAVSDCHRIDDEDGPQQGRSNAAEWLRTAYHDMATANVKAGTGGIDASIGFEFGRDENKGQAFRETLKFMLRLYNPRASMADLIAMGATFALGSCSNGTVLVPYKGGRVDATGPGPSGVPRPEQDLETHKQIFANQNFTVDEMIGLVACGHTLGGVHGNDFPDIAPVTKNQVRCYAQ
jgi:hypothetical protein